MSDFTGAASRVEQAYRSYRLAIAVAGTVAIVVGLVILLWPSIALNVIAVTIGAYAVIAGAIYLGIGIFSKQLTVGGRTGRIILGTALLVLGVLSLVFSGATATVLLWIIAIAVGLAWITEGALTLMAAIRGRQTNTWILIYAVIAILAGVAVLLSPTYGDGITLFRWLFGISFLALGVAQIVRVLAVGRSTVAVEIVD